MIPPTRSARLLATLCVSLVIAACGGGSDSPANGGSPDSAVAPSFALNKAAFEKGVTYWNTLPHTDIPGDLAAVARELESSGVAAATSVSESAIRATLADGSKFLFVYDTRTEASGLIDVEAVKGASASPSRAARQSTAQGEGSTTQALLTEDSLSLKPTGRTKHEIVFLVNDAQDDHVTFDLAHTVAFANSFIKAGLPSSAYQVDATAVDIDYILALGSTHPIDYLSINTHGSVDCDKSGADCDYTMLSVTRPNIDSWAGYFGDIQKKTLMGGAALLKLKTATDAASFDFSRTGHYWFTPEFLTTYLTFNPGAVVMNSSCFAQDSRIAAAVSATFAKAGVGLYSGWNGTARAEDADQSDGYLLDRLLGSSADNGLGALGLEFMTKSPLILQRTPAQRAFPLTDVMAAMQTTQRFPFPKWMDDKYPGQYALPYNAGPHTLTQSTLSNNRLVFTTLNGGGDNNHLIVWGLPSIATMSTVEGATGATLVVNGSFPATPGKGQIVDASGTYPLTPVSWSKTRITFQLPPTGAGSSGVVTVFSDEGVPGNSVALTEWTGQLVVTVDDTGAGMSSSGGSAIAGVGSGTIQTTTSLHFRSDVHPVVTTIDTPPVAQNFVFSGMMGDSTSSVTLADATFRADDGLNTVHFSLEQPVTTQTPAYDAAALPAGRFIIGPYTGADAPASCNNGLPGPQASGSRPANVFCPFGGINVASALVCSDAGSGLCAAPLYDYTGFYGYPPFLTENSSYVTGDDGQLIFTMDPKTYLITFTSKPAHLVQDYLFDSGENLNIDLAATIRPPVNAPH